MIAMLYPCILCAALLMDLFVLCVACLTGVVNYLAKQFVPHIVFICHQDNVCEIFFCSVIVGRYCGLGEIGLCVLSKL